MGLQEPPAWRYGSSDSTAVFTLGPLALCLLKGIIRLGVYMFFKGGLDSCGTLTSLR